MAARVTKGSSGKGYERYTISVPTRIGRLIPTDQKFEAELTEEGLLFRPVEFKDPIPDLPSWATRPEGPPEES